MKEVIINVEGMHCEGCANRIINILKTIKNIKNVEADYETGKVKIFYNKDINLEDIKEKIESIDFKIINSSI